LEITIEQILNGIPDKREWKTTTSLKFKRDLYKYFSELDVGDKNVIELGTSAGYTTRVLSFLFNRVFTFDIEDDGKSKIFNKDRDNISHLYQDIYSISIDATRAPWWKIDDNISVIFIDAAHDYDKVKMDINNSLKVKDDCMIIFDDYGLMPGVKRAVYEAIKEKRIKPVCYLGEPPGADCRRGKFLTDWEGLICVGTKGVDNE